MNQTLEEMARALFKSWFVDFDPVRAKAALKQDDVGDHATRNGEPSGDGAASTAEWTVERARAYLDAMAPQIADLFPDRLVPSELGEIPEGWEVKSLGDCIHVVRGLSYKGASLSTSGFPMHNLNSVYEGGGYKDERIKYYEGGYRPDHLICPHDVIVANTEQGHDRLLIGYAAIVTTRFGNNGLFSHHLYKVQLKNSASLTSEYVCKLLNSAAMHDVVSGYATGTTVNMLPVDALKIPTIVLPPSKLVGTFSAAAESVYNEQETLIADSQVLAAQRDALLPLLVSGKVRV